MTTVDVLDTAGAGRLMLRGGALRTAGYAGGVLLALLSAPLLVRHLGVADFGRWVTITSLVFIVSGLTELGLTTVGQKEYAVRDREGRHALIRSLASVRVVAGAAGLLTTVGFAAVAGYGDELVAGGAIASASLVVNGLQATYSTPLNVWLRLGRVTVIDVVRQAATVALIVVLVLLGADLLPFFAVPTVSALVALAITVAFVRHEIPLLPTMRLAPAWQLVRATLPFAAATALGIVYFRVEIILMSLISGDEETGNFGVAFRVVEIASGIPWLLVSAAFPILARAAKDDDTRLRYALGRLFEGSLIVGTTMALAIGFGASFAVSVLGGDDRSVPALQVLSVALVGTFLVATWAFALLSLGRYGALLAANVLALAVGVGLTFLLVPPYGAVGAAAAVSATEAVLAAMYGAALVRARPDLNPPLRIAGAVVAGLVVAGVLVFVDLPSAIETVLAPGAFLATLAALRAIPTEIIEAARRR